MKDLDIPFDIIKKVMYIQDSKYKYHIDEDGNGVAYIDDFEIIFNVNEYGEILIDSIHVI